MLKSEDEAKEAYCSIAHYERCRGSHCMAWRWMRYGTSEGEKTDKGYCGLVGRP